jgi:hypothetical protein
METEMVGHIPFLDIDVYRRPGSSLGHRVCRKPTHTHTNATSHHHPANKQAVLSTLVHGTKVVCDTDRFPQELQFLRETFRNNGYGEKQIFRALNPPTRDPPPREDHTSVSFLPFVDITFNCISRVQSKRNIKTVGLPPRKLSSFLRSVKDHLALKTPGVYSIPCDFGKVYIGQTGRSTDEGKRTSTTYLSRTS